jgi:sugar lactone lactonase YvrE
MENQIMSRVRSVSMATHMALLTFVFLLASCWAATAQTPAMVMSLHRTVYSNLTKGVSRVAANARGDVFFEDPANAQIVEVPAGSTTPIPLLIQITAGASSTPDGVMVDSSGNVYVAAAYDGRVVRIPFVNGTYATNTSMKDLKTANTLCTTGMQVPCVFPTSSWAAVGYYMQTGDVAIDAAGDLFFVDISDSASGGGTVNRIVELTANGTVNVVANNLPHVTSAQIASDRAGNLYYAEGQGSSSGSLPSTYLYYIPAGSVGATPTPITSALKNPTGVTFDQAGNLIISDTGNSRIVVVPLENGTLNFADLYVLTPQYSQNSVGIDSFGTVYYTGAASGSTSINASHTQVFSAGLIPVLNNSTTYTLQASFNRAATFAGIYTQGNGATVTATLGTCAVGTAYNPAQSCSLNLTISPTRVGPVSGVMGVKTSDGSVIGEFAYAATGQGSQLTLDPGTAAAVGSGYQNPAGVAVDGAGNVFVVDASANTVYELVAGSGSPVALGTGLNGPTGAAVDYAGDLFIADTGNGRVIEIQNLGGTLASSSQTTIASGLNAPLAIATGPLDTLYIAQAGQLARYDVRGVPTSLTTVLSTAIGRPGALAVDASGNVFVGDSSAGTVTEIVQGTNAATTVASGLTAPTGLAVDPAGDLFLVDSGTAQVVRIPVVNGTLSYADAVSAGKFSSPWGLAIDSTGNLFVSNTNAPGLFQVNRSSGLLDFGNLNVGDTGPVLTATLVSSGNLASGTTPLTLGTPLYSASGDTTDFSVSSTGTCAAGLTLAPGACCTLQSSFAPTANGSVSEALTINVENMAPVQLTLSGSGRALAETSLGVALTSPTGALTYGKTATFTTTLTPSAFNTAPATGQVTFVINDVTQRPVPLQSDGTASIQTTALSGGSNTIYASYSGDENYKPSTSPEITSTVATAPTSTALTLTTTYVNPVSQQAGTPVTLTAHVTPSVEGVLSGTVNFMSGGTNVGSATLDPSHNAVLTTSSLAAGTYNIVAVFEGSTNYSSSTSAAASLIVSPGGIQMSSSSSSLTSSGSAPGSVMLSVSSVAGLSGAVTLSCSGLPSYAVCNFSPQYFTLAKSPASAPVAATPVQLSVLLNVNPGSQKLTAASKSSRPTGPAPLLCSMLFSIPLLTVLSRRRRRSRLVTVLVLCLLCLALCLGLAGCSGTSQRNITPTGTTPVTITAASSTATTSLTINVTVNQ